MFLKKKKDYCVALGGLKFILFNTIVLDPLYIEVGIVHWNDFKRGTVDDPNSVCLFAQEGKAIQSYNIAMHWLVSS